MSERPDPGRDVADRRRPVAAPAEREVRLCSLTADISDAIWKLDLEQRLLYVGPPIERFAGYTSRSFSNGPPPPVR